MQLCFRCARGGQNRLGAGHFIRRSVDDQHKLSGFERSLVLQDAVLWNADAVKPGANGAKSTDNGRSLQGGNDPPDDWAGRNQWADAGNHEKCGPKQHSPYAAPESAVFAPMLHPLAGRVIAHDIFLRVISLSDNLQPFHVEGGLLQLFDRVFRLRVLIEYRNDRIVF